jgi:transposase
MIGAAEVGAWIGIDWADHEHRVVLFDVANQVRTSVAVKQTPLDLQEWVAGVQARYRGGRVAIALEQSRGALFYALTRYEFIDLYPVNPKTLAKFREALRPSGGKDDPDDATLLMELLRDHRDRLRKWRGDDANTRQLRLLVEHRRTLVDERTALSNRLRALLKESFPQALGWAGGLTSAQACVFLRRWSSLDAIELATDTELTEFYRTHRHGKQWISQRLAEMRVTINTGTDPVVVAAHTPMVRALAAQLQILAGAIGQLDQTIAMVFRAHHDAELFISFPNAGPALAPRLAVAFGTDRDRYTQAVELAQLSGIAPVTRRSGASMVVHSRWACPKFIKQTFQEYARVSIGASEWARAFYRDRRARGHSHQAAVRALAYRWIRIMFRCWKDRSRYDEQLYQRSLAQRGSPLAAALTAA